MMSELKYNSSMQWVIIFALLLSFLSCKEEMIKTKPEYRNLVISVYASLIIQPQDYYDVYPEGIGIIKTIYKKEGDLVTKGEILAEIEREIQSYDLSNAALDEDQARRNLYGEANQLFIMESEIISNRKQLTQDSLNYERQKILWSQNIGSKQEYENRKLILDLAKEKLITSEQRYHQTKQELENKYRISKNRYQKSKAIQKNYNVISKMDGKIYKLNKNEGELILQQEIFAQIGSDDQFIIELQIDEVDIINVKLDQYVIIALDAMPDHTFEAKVDKIYPTKNSRTQTFTVEASFIIPPDQLYAGLSGEANIIISEDENVLCIPVEYLTGKNTVMNKDGDEIAIKLGNRNMKFVQVLSGLDTSSIIVLSQ